MKIRIWVNGHEPMVVFADEWIIDERGWLNAVQGMEVVHMFPNWEKIEAMPDV